ncbi:hypothetical protein OS493_034389 [Desmophyllum pertusum]|uniref:Uncharacterized protein n=1 Tax=Desmophyllum pertusum TaxID=174260 RepID=A0A9W9ZWW3_9CNID|nr:hypothetical protein OS493_034389 [Desmophyllum pertusum]
MNLFSALFFSLLFVAHIRRLHAPDGSEEASNIPKPGKPELSESSNLVTNTEEDTKQSESSDDASTPSQEISSSFSSSTSELEELATPTVAPATPSYDTESSTTISTASSIVSHSQANDYVFSSVILIPPSNPGQIQSSEGTQVVKESTYSEPVPTQEPEVMSSVLDSTPPTPISSDQTPTPPSPAMAKEEEDSITAALNQAEEESKPKEEEMPSFDEFKKKLLQKRRRRASSRVPRMQTKLRTNLNLRKSRKGNRAITPLWTAAQRFLITMTRRRMLTVF